MRVLVTGGLGYVGGAIACALSQRDHHVVSIDDLSRNSIGDPTAFGYTNLNIPIQSPAVRDLLLEFKPDVVVHCAASAMIEEGERNRADYFTNNVVNHAQFLSQLVRANVRRFIYSSTAAVYKPSDEPIDEGRPLEPTSWYGWTKLIAESILSSLVESDLLQGVVFRYFSVVGSAWGIAENRSYDEHAVTSLLRCAETNDEFVLYGGNHPTRDGSPVRDFVSLRDVARAHVIAAELLDRGGVSDMPAMNLGAGRGVTILELLAMVERVSGKRIAVRIGPRRPGDPSVMICNGAKAREVIGWTPRYLLESELADLWQLRTGG